MFFSAPRPPRRPPGARSVFGLAGESIELPPPPFTLLRIIGGSRILNTGGDAFTTWYAGVEVDLPNGYTDLSKPADLVPAKRHGPLNDDMTSDAWWLLEVSGNDNVPTDGSVVVLAWPARNQTSFIFQYSGRRFARIDAKKTTGSTTWYTWTEMEPDARAAGGITWQVKTGGDTGSEETGPILRNPLFELNQTDIPVGTIVELLQHPVRTDTATDESYLQQRPACNVRITVAANGTSIHQTQAVDWYGALGGTYKLKVTNASGTSGTSATINFTDAAAAIKTALQASGVATAMTVTGTGANFSVVWEDNYSTWPFLQVAESNLWTDMPYFCEFGGGSGGTAGRWIKVDSGFTAETAPTAHHFQGYICDSDGSNASASLTTVYLENSPYRFPNLEANDIVPITWNDAKSQWMCHVQDDFVGAIKLITPGTTIPQGWENYTAANGYLVMGDSTGDGTQAGTAGSMSVTVFDSGVYSVYDCPACVYRLNLNSTLTSDAWTKLVDLGFDGGDVLMDGGGCPSTYFPCKIPEFTKENALPSILLRYIVRVDNSI